MSTNNTGNLPDNSKPPVKKYVCKWCGVSTPNPCLKSRWQWTCTQNPNNNS